MQPEGLFPEIAGDLHSDVLVLGEVRHVIEDVFMAGYNLQELSNQTCAKNPLPHA